MKYIFWLGAGISIPSPTSLMDGKAYTLEWLEYLLEKVIVLKPCTCIRTDDVYLSNICIHIVTYDEIRTYTYDTKGNKLKDSYDKDADGIMDSLRRA